MFFAHSTIITPIANPNSLLPLFSSSFPPILSIPPPLPPYPIPHYSRLLSSPLHHPQPQKANQLTKPQGVSTTHSTLTLPSLLALPTAPTAHKTLSLLTHSTTHLTHPLRHLSTFALLAAYFL